MNYLFIIISLSFLSTTVFSKERTELDATMFKLFDSLVNLQIMASTPERFSGKESQEIIKKDLEILSKARHAFTSKPKTEEPGMMAVLSMFSHYVKDTRESLERNQEYARHRVRTLGAFCLGCHSRISVGEDFEDVGGRIEKLRLNDFEKAELYAATRQFDKAVSTFSLYLQSTPKGSLDFINYTRALKHFTRLKVRVKQDPEGLLKTLSQLAKRKDLPEYNKRMIKNWLKDAEHWAKDRVVVSDLTMDALFKKATGLVKHAETLHDYPADENADISYLRASGYLHEILEREPKSKLRGEALLLLGRTYQSLAEPFLWELDQIFFEECIREYSRTPLSKKCYQYYSKSVHANYTGSGGTFIPDDVLKKLEDLKHLTP